MLLQVCAFNLHKIALPFNPTSSLREPFIQSVVKLRQFSVQPNSLTAGMLEENVMNYLEHRIERT